MKSLRDYIELIETIAPTDFHRQQTYYHGTKIQARADSIMRDGILPQDPTTVGHKKQGMMTPVAGAVYLTPELSYAVMYALGGDMAGHDFGGDRIGTEPFGYVFVVPGNHLTAIQPDEDEVGQATRWAVAALAGDTLSLRYETNSPFKQQIWADTRLCQRLANDARRVLTAGQYTKLTRDGSYAIMAQAGKKMLKTMWPETKETLIRYGCHLSQTGGAQPTECWRIAKQDSIKLAKDGSNFFDIAERVWTKQQTLGEDAHRQSKLPPFTWSDRGISDEYHKVWIDVAKLDASWAQDRDSRVGPGGQGGIRTRYPDFIKWMEKGIPIEMPRVSISYYGHAFFGNGRHRFAVMRDHGVKSLPVLVADEDVEEMTKRFGV